MAQGMIFMRMIGFSAAASLALLGLVQCSQTGPATVETAAEQPLVLAKQGYFYAGGKYDESNPNRHIIGAMYVEYKIPAALTHPFPIVMVHGGGVHGASWYTTPDGREGWAPYFLRKGYAVYVIDQVGRGRSLFHEDSYGAMSSQSREYVLQKFTSQERYKLWPQAALHNQFPGTGEPGDSAFDQYWAADVPGMDNRIAQAEMNIAALTDLLDRIGPSILLVHSQSGGYAWPVAQARPGLVKAIAAAEPAGPPVHDVVVKSVQRFDQPWENTIKQTEDDWFRDNPGVKRYGLTNTPLAYEPAVTDASPLAFVQQEAPDRPDLSRCWKQAEPARQLVAVGERPILIIEGEASFYAGYNHCNVGYLEQAGAEVDFIKLADRGIHGTGHMMMLEKDSDQVAGVIADWLAEKVGPLEAGVALTPAANPQPLAIEGVPASTAAPLPPITLAKSGVFYVGGRYDETNPNNHIVGQMYVEYQIPANVTKPYPMLIVHGGGQTGAGWWSTPDGREGWAQNFLRQGYAVYVVDQIGRGRSPYTPEVYGPMDSQSLPYLMEKFTPQERWKHGPQAAFHTQWPGIAEPGDPVFDQYWASDAPAMTDRLIESNGNVDALVELVDKIGPVVLLVHSQSGALGWPLAQRRPNLIKAIAAAEPSGPPVHQIVVKSSEQRFGVAWDDAWKQNEEDHYRDIPRTKEYGLGDVYLEYEPAVTRSPLPDSPVFGAADGGANKGTGQLEFVQEEKSQAPDLARCWRQKEPARKLQNLAMPVMILEGEASFYAGYNHCNVQYLEQAGVTVEFIKLKDLGIRGNGHMMMMEKNSADLARVIGDWFDKAVPSQTAEARATQ
jgi:pimeloyl-ACP methyl ester carboxylesterase